MPKQLDLFTQPTPKQLWLLNFKNPLVDRLGREFFSKLPKTPGVYKMKNERGEIVYVGKAKSLRERVRSYTHANTENSSRKVLRMIQSIRAIEIEELASEKAALLRENHLLRTLKPFFNVVNTAPHTYLFFHLDLTDEGLKLHLAMKPDPAYPHFYGAFKGLGLCYRAHKALLRTLWFSFNGCRHGFEIPGNLTNRRKLDHHLFRPEGADPAAIRRLHLNLKRFLNGTSRTLLDRLVDALLAREDLAPFTRHLIQEDLETLVEFYERCARRNRQLKRALAIKEHLVPQDQLDDFLVLVR